MIRTQGDKKIVLAKKKKKLRIFLDMDGVVVFWEKGAAKTLDLNLEDKDIREKIKNGKRMESFVGGDSVMWPKIDKEGAEWWEKLEKLPWADGLINLIKKESKEWCFLTAPSNNSNCAAGKIKWLQNHFGEDFRKFLIGSNKYMCASPDALLIDDSEKKCKKFEEYGGYSFLWPSPLNLIDEDENLDDVMFDLKKLIQEIS